MNHSERDEQRGPAPATLVGNPPSGNDEAAILRSLCIMVADLLYRSAEHPNDTLKDSYYGAGSVLEYIGDRLIHYDLTPKGADRSG